MFARRPLLALASLTLLFAACRKAEIASYRVPKEQERELPPVMSATPAAPTLTPDMSTTPVTTADGKNLAWTAPAQWKAKSGSAMRKGSYSVPGEGGAEADLSITAFPGDVGGELANLNRWRGQIQLPAITAAELASATTHLDSNGLHLTVVDLVGTGANPQRILGAIIPVGEATWFFKLLGPDALVAKEKNAFDEFLKTVKLAAPATP